MGEVRVPVRLVNSVDAVLQEEQSTRKLRAFDGVGVVDSGAVMLAVPAEVSEALGLRERAKVLVRLADESQLELAVAGPVDITISGRTMSTEAAVLPPGSEILIGQIVLERLDLLVDCQNQTLVPRPESPIYPSLKLK
jgi:clan AA aspartic protease